MLGGAIPFPSPPVNRRGTISICSRIINAGLNVGEDLDATTDEFHDELRKIVHCGDLEDCRKLWNGEVKQGKPLVHDSRTSMGSLTTEELVGFLEEEERLDQWLNM